MIISKETCPYFGKEKREEWYRKRGIEDPLEEVVGKEPTMEDPVPYKPEAPKIELPKVEESKSDGMTKEQRYRAANKEKLAAKARERRKK